MTMGGTAGSRPWASGRARGRLGGRAPVRSELPCTSPEGPPPAPRNSPLSPCPSVSLCPLCLSLLLFVSLSISVSPPRSHVSPCVLSHISPYFSALLEPSPLRSAATGCGVSRCPCWPAVKSPRRGGVGNSPPPPLAQTLAQAQGHTDERIRTPCPSRAGSAASKVCALGGPLPLRTCYRAVNGRLGRAGDPRAESLGL